jgi:peroxiredoxin
LEALSASSAAEIATERAFRVDHSKTDLLASEIKQSAQPFRLKNLEGRDVALADFRGRIVIAPFWATWCGPCIQELAALNRIYPAIRDRAEVLAISIDDTMSIAAEFAKRNAYVFPILKSDGSVEAAYATASSLQGTNIPQLWVFDGDGNIRFHLTGFDEDGLFEQRVNWMIAAIK